MAGRAGVPIAVPPGGRDGRAYSAASGLPNYLRSNLRAKRGKAISARNRREWVQLALAGAAAGSRHPLRFSICNETFQIPFEDQCGLARQIGYTGIEIIAGCRGRLAESGGAGAALVLGLAVCGSFRLQTEWRGSSIRGAEISAQPSGAADPYRLAAGEGIRSPLNTPIVPPFLIQSSLKVTYLMVRRRKL